MRRHGNKELSDERVLGSGDFVERIIKEADEQFKYQFSEKERRKKVEQIISIECRDGRINIKELRSGSRRHPVCKIRLRIAITLFSEYGILKAEIARNTGVSTSAVSKMVNKSINK